MNFKTATWSFQSSAMRNKRTKTTEIILFTFSFKELKGRLTVRDGSWVTQLNWVTSITIWKCNHMFQFCKLPLSRVATHLYYALPRKLKLTFFTAFSATVRKYVSRRRKLANNKTNHQRKNQVCFQQRSLQRCEVRCSEDGW